MKSKALTARQEQVFELIGQALPQKLVADDLGITIHTVRLHVRALFKKFGVGSSLELCRIWWTTYSNRYIAPGVDLVESGPVSKPRATAAPAVKESQPGPGKASVTPALARQRFDARMAADLKKRGGGPPGPPLELNAEEIGWILYGIAEEELVELTSPQHLSQLYFAHHLRSRRQFRPGAEHAGENCRKLSIVQAELERLKAAPARPSQP